MPVLHIPEHILHAMRSAETAFRLCAAISCDDGSNLRSTGSSLTDALAITICSNIGAKYVSTGCAASYDGGNNIKCITRALLASLSAAHSTGPIIIVVLFPHSDSLPTTPGTHLSAFNGRRNNPNPTTQRIYTAFQVMCRSISTASHPLHPGHQ